MPLVMAPDRVFDPGHPEPRSHSRIFRDPWLFGSFAGQHPDDPLVSACESGPMLVKVRGLRSRRVLCLTAETAERAEDGSFIDSAISLISAVKLMRFKLDEVKMEDTL